MTELKVNLQGSWKRILAMITVAAMCFTVIYVSPVSAASDENKSITVTTVSEASEVTATASADKSEIQKGGATAQMTGEVKVTGDEIPTGEWVSSNNEIATVSEDGKVEAVTDGDATVKITLKVGTLVSNPVELKVLKASTNPGPNPGGDDEVSPSVTKVTVDPTTATMTVDETKVLKAKVDVSPTECTAAEVNAVEWTTDKPAVATVDANGKVTAVAKGEAKITVTSKYDKSKSATCAVTVKEKTVTPPPADNKTPDSNTVGTTKKPAKATVTLNATKLTMKKGTSTKALKVKKASVKGDKIKAVKTSNKKVVAVTKKGQTITLKAKKTGKATITVTMNSGAKATVKVTVNNKKVVTKKLTMSKKTAKVKKGKKLTLTVTRNPINATEKITWKSSNKKIATVKNGKVTVKKNAKAGKKVTITARTTNGKKATCKITVKK